MLKGEFNVKLTDKNRLALPAEIRKELKGKYVISRGYEGCLILLDEMRWEKLIKLITIEPILNLSVRDTYRFIIGGAEDIDLDKQGRFVLPESLRIYAQIKTEATFLGISEWVEIWSQESWKKKLAYLQQNAADIAEKLLKTNEK